MMHTSLALLPYFGAAILAGFLAVYFFYPVILVQFYLRFSVLYSGMRLKYVEIDGLSMCYGEKGRMRKGHPSMLLLHGFTSDKFMWVSLLRNISSDIHVIAVDLPGHGDSATPNDDEDISHTRTVDTMQKFIKKTEFDQQPFHLVGMSLGGALAGLFAAEFPDAIHSLTMICPAMFKSFASQDMHYLLKSRSHKIVAPTQIIWGEEDQVMNKSGAEELKQLLPNCQKVDIIPRCGHSMDTDRPGAMTKAIMTFRQQMIG